jgi:hypothetical protein
MFKKMMTGEKGKQLSLQCFFKERKTLRSTKTLFGGWVLSIFRGFSLFAADLGT